MSELLTPFELRSALMPLASVTQKKKGTILFRRGEEGIGVFLVFRGKVNLRLDGRASVYPCRTLGSGSILGLPATLSGGTYSLQAEVSEDAELGFVSRQDLLELLAKDTKLCLEVMNMLGKEITSTRLALVSHKAKKSHASRNGG
ncbi:MAG TPA: cyclic nucleotide-binding domain-containing protein [Terriglobales bacterium]|nr:cyclic nucleotide-binding domain-containing protein [Terriglobales bacterium]HXY14064.1 cyclic nucleotide-binding domain-containing protein [Terriglobales bacterium]